MKKFEYFVKEIEEIDFLQTPKIIRIRGDNRVDPVSELECRLNYFGDEEGLELVSIIGVYAIFKREEL